MAKRGFTLIELLVVIAMLAVLMGSFGSSVAAARRRAQIARATQEAKEMTNAILAYEQYAPNRSLSAVARGSWAECSESAMAMILGGVTGANGEPVPVLYNAHVSGGSLRDPWGTPYQYKIESTSSLQGGGDDEARALQLKTAAALPNYFRLKDEERK